MSRTIMPFRAAGPALALLFTLLLARLPVAAGAQTMENRELGLKITVTERWSEIAGSYVPLQLELENRGEARRLPIVVKVQGFWTRLSTLSRATATIELPAHGTTRWELPVLRPHPNAWIDLELPGIDLEPAAVRLHLSLSDYPRLLYIGQEADTLPASIRTTMADGEAREMIHPIPPESASRQWQAYAGLNGAIMLEPAMLPRLDAAQREALRTWVCVGGGMLWIRGEGGSEAARALELPLEATTGTGGCLTGSVRLFDSKRYARASFDTVLRSGQEWNTAWQLSRLGLWSWDRRQEGTLGSWLRPLLRPLLEGLHTSPRAGFALLSTLFALLIGPVNLFLLYKRNRLILFYGTAPLLAGASMFVLVAWTVVKDGLGVKAKESAVLLHDPSSGMGAAYHLRAIFAAFAPASGLALPAESLAVPIEPESGRGGLSSGLITDWTSGQRLERGWIRGREVSGLATITPARVRMGVSVRREPTGEVVLENGLGHRVVRALARLSDREYGWNYFEIEEVAPGATRAMRPLKSGPSMPTTSFFQPDLRKMDWTVVAETDGLPHLETGGLTAELLSGSYTYIGVGRPE